MTTRRGSWTCVFCFSLACGLSQQQAPPKQFAPTPSVQPGGAPRQVTLDVVVSDKSGSAITGLKQENFTILDNKCRQKIVSFHAVEGVTAAPDPPVEVILVVDEINTPFTRLASERTEIERFLRQNNGVLARPLSMAFLSDAGMTVGNAPSQDGNAAIADLNRNRSGLRVLGRSLEPSALFDRMQSSLRALTQLANDEEAKAGRKLVVWISPGWPFIFSMPVETSRDKQTLFNAHVTLSNALRRARITLYSIDPFGLANMVTGETSYYKQFLTPLRTAKQAETGHLALQVLASHSGGLVFNSSNDVAGEIAACVADANTFYVLSYDGLTGTAPDEHHAIEIKLDKPGFAARTRVGYYAQSER